jgi:NAD-dependent SIR2 family protein deacetylase
VNVDATELSDEFDVVLRGKAGELLPQLVAMLAATGG